MICRKIYETRIHGLCGTAAPGVVINCEHSKTKCSLNCSPQCSGYEEAGSVQTPTVAQKQHNREFIEYIANAPTKTEPIKPLNRTPSLSPIAVSPIVVQNNAKNNLPQLNGNKPASGGCDCSGNSYTRTNYTAPAKANYIR
jgi:hypothetical protein